jgi:hypothetical protein
MKKQRILTWLDVKRIIQKETLNGKRLPERVLKIECFSDALEVSISKKEEVSYIDTALKKWFGDWYKEKEHVIEFDFFDTKLPVEFIYETEKIQSHIPLRPFWEEIVYADTHTALPEKFPDEQPTIVSFYSFKGGVGRTLHLAAFLFALLEQAKEAKTPVTVLVIDADLEAPGLTYWNRKESQQPTVSFLYFLELYQCSLYEKKMFEFFAKEVKRSAKKEGDSTWYFLPACLEDKQLLDTFILPEHLARNHDGWTCGKAIYDLGKTLGAEYVFLDLRAGLSEISSPLLFDPRIQRYLVTTLTEQSWKGVSLVIDQISNIILPKEETQDYPSYHDPVVIMSMLRPEYKQLSDFYTALESLQTAYCAVEETGKGEHAAEEESGYSEKLQIIETYFAEELLYINSWEEARSQLSSTSLLKEAKEWAKKHIQRHVLKEQKETTLPTDQFQLQMAQAKKLRELCEDYEFAETGKGTEMLITQPLRNLAKNFNDAVPRVISLGAKGSGKTFNYIRLARFGTWKKFIQYVKEESELEAYIFPLLESNSLSQEAKNITGEARENVRKILGSQDTFLHSEFRKKIKAKLDEEKNLSESDWDIFWIEELFNALDMHSTGKKDIFTLNNLLKEHDKKVIFLFDGLEDLFAEVSSEDKQKKALQALIQLPNKISEIKESNIGCIIFIRHDFIRYIVHQNILQFERLYHPYNLSWDEKSFKKLVYWICSQAQVIDAEEAKIEHLSLEDFDACLEKLWGTKLGSDTSNEAFTIRWIFAALTDFKGRLQARDIVRFLYNAANIALESASQVMTEKWASSRMLPPQALRKAIAKCSEKKVEEAQSEYPEFQKWIETIGNNPNYKKVPFTLEDFPTDPETIRILEEMGVIYEDKDKDGTSCFYMPEIFRIGLKFSFEKGARPRVLVLKRKALGSRP